METTAERQKENRPKVGMSPASHEAATPEAALHPVLQLQRDVGNQAVRQLLRAGMIQARLNVSQPDDAEEREADRVADHLLLAQEPLVPSAPLPSLPPPETAALSALPGAVGETLRSPGQPLGAVERAFFEPRLGHDFSRVRVHTDAAAESSTREIKASAYTAGDHVAFASGQFNPGSSSGRRLLGHELAHVVQQRYGRPGGLLQRQHNPSAQSGDPPTAQYNENLVPPDWIKQPAVGDILTVISNGKMVALPAAGAIVLIQPPAGGISPDTPVFTVPTVAKEGLVAVNVGGRTGFMIDAGGTPTVVFPGAMAAIQDALGISSVRGVVVTHIHSDHVRSLVELVITNGITPPNLHFPAAFAANPAAPSSMFANGLRTLEADARALALGYGPRANYSVIPTPQGGAFFHRTLQEGEVTFDFYGLSQEFRDLEAARTRGAAQPNADTASLLTRVTHVPSGYRVLYVGDLRGGDLNKIRQAMGDGSYGEMLTGVKVIEGLQHHLGALEDKADRDGIVQLLTDTYLRTGELTVVAQSQEEYGGKQFLNRSLIEGLNELGIDVHVAMRPGAGGAVGTITGTSSGQIETRGGGRIESHFGSQEMQKNISRLIRLRKAEETMSQYENYLNPPGRRSADVRAARQSLETALKELVETTLGNVRTGADRGQPSLQDPAVQQAAMRKAEATYEVEDLLTPHNMEVLGELGRVGPYLRIWEEEVKKAKETGEMSERGVEALWEVNPSLARQAVGASNMPASMQRQTLAQLPGQGMPVGTRIGAGVMLAITVIEELAPLIQAAQQSAFDDDVAKGLGDIMWWQSKGVFPEMHAFTYHVLKSNADTRRPSEIQSLLDNKDVGYLVLTRIPEEGFALLAAWAKTHLLNIRDWAFFITNTNSVKKENDKWKYHCGTIDSGITGHYVTEKWQESDFLTTVLNTAFDRVLASTQTSLSAVEHGRVPVEGPAYSDPNVHQSPPVYEGKPQAIGGKKKFKDGIKEPTLYTLHQHWERTGFSKDATFYVFPNSASPENVPSGYVVVGGADSWTYYEIYETQNLVREGKGDDDFPLPIFPNRLEELLAKSDDLVDAT